MVHPKAGDQLVSVGREEQQIVASCGVVRHLSKTDRSGCAGFKVGEGLVESSMFTASGFYMLRSPTVDPDQVSRVRCLLPHLEVGTACECGRACLRRRVRTQQRVDESVSFHKRIMAPTSGHAADRATVPTSARFTDTSITMWCRRPSAMQPSGTLFW